MNLNDINLDNQIECRICFDDRVNDELISPCRCNGTSKYIHRGCLHTWRQYNLGKEGETHCMECREEYILRRKHQYEPNNLFRRGIFPFISFNYLLSITYNSSSLLLTCGVNCATAFPISYTTFLKSKSLFNGLNTILPYSFTLYSFFNQ